VSPITVLHLRQGAGLYGADRAVLALAGATPAPFRALVGAVSADAGFALSDEAARLGLPSLRFRTTRRIDLRCAREIARAAREQGARLLHAHDFKTLFLALFAGALAEVPVVATYHGETGSTAAVRAYELFARLLGNSTNGVAVVSRSLERRLRRWVRFAPLAFVPNGLPTPQPLTTAERAESRAALGLRPDELVLAVVGRLSPEKGHEILLQALRTLARPPVLLVAGDGLLRAALEEQARGLPVRFLGYLADPRPVFAAADALAIPSLTEGLPLVALEAAALKLPIVASAVGELPMLLARGAGALVPPGAVQPLAQAIESLREPSVRERLGGAAALAASAYGADAMAAGYVALYRRALSSDSAARTPSSSR
jgi:glycosyltransferase involved in cell wall biosynthesis